MDRIKEVKYIQERNAKLINLIADFAIENEMTMQEIDECIDVIRELYYSDGIVRR